MEELIMSNKQSLSSSRNHYFFGKLMTVRDFENEQIYMNSKRHLGNKLLSGSGIVSGLDVLLIDNKTISIEPGMALDYLGREIILPEPVVKKLDVISGFDENIEHKDDYLCVEYDEELSETTFSVVGSSKSGDVSREYNQINEGYKLSITSKKPNENLLRLDELAVSKTVLYENDNVRLSIEVDRFANPGGIVKLSVIFEKNEVQSLANYEFKAKGLLFKTVSGEKELVVNYQESDIVPSLRVVKEYYLMCDATAVSVGEIEIPASAFKIGVGAQFDAISEDVKIPVQIVDGPIRDCIISDFYKKKFDDIIIEKDEQKIYLAKISLIADRATYLIQNIVVNPFKQYVLNNELLDVIQKRTTPNICGFERVESKTKEETKNALEVNLKNVLKSSNVRTGVARINLGLYAKPGKVYYSNEFVHGLGYGEVAVVAAIESKDKYESGDKNSIIFGDVSVFLTGSTGVLSPDVSIGALVDVQKGTIKFGAKLMNKTSSQFVDIKWWAFKSDENDKDILNTADIKVIVSPNAAQVKPYETIRFSSNIEGAQGQSVVWSVPEAGGGSIDENGLYKAPENEGVYEVRAQSVEFADKHDSAYVVVSSAD